MIRTIEMPTRAFGKSTKAAMELRQFLMDIDQDKIAMIFPLKHGFAVKLFDKDQFMGLGIKGLNL